MLLDDDMECPVCGDRAVKGDSYQASVPPNHPEWWESVQRVCSEGHVWVRMYRNEID